MGAAVQRPELAEEVGRERVPHRGERGAALVEYALMLPVLLLLFFGSLEIFRLYSIQQTLRSALKQVLPCFNHGKDIAYRSEYSPACEVRQFIIDELRQNPFAVSVLDDAVVVWPDLSQLRNVPDGEVFEVAVEARVALGYLYPLWNKDWIVLRESYATFIDSSPAYYELAPDVPFPYDPGSYPP